MIILRINMKTKIPEEEEAQPVKQPRRQKNEKIYRRKYQ